MDTMDTMDTMDDNTCSFAVHAVHTVHTVHTVHSSLREQQLSISDRLQKSVMNSLCSVEKQAVRVMVSR
ncbi:MAG: hypothetical protein ACOX9E_15350 [Lentisphaeria bacterium]